MFILCSLLTLLAVGPGDASPLPSVDLPSYGGLLLKTILALVIVIGLAWVLLRWGLKRLLPGTGRSAGEIRVLDRQSLDGRRSVVLVEAYGRYLLLGVGDGSVTLLAELDPETVAEAERQRASRPQKRFADVLRAALGREKPAPEPITRPDSGDGEPGPVAPDKDRR
jgi:flagellar protein FliO/FliZ